MSESADTENGGGGDHTASQPLQLQNLSNSGKKPPRRIAYHAAYFALNGLLLAYIQLMYPNSPTAFETHYANMITSLISLCLYVVGIIVRMMVKAKDITCSLTIFNHALIFSGILTPVSLVSVFLPYKPLWLVVFICALFSIILIHYFFLTIKAAVINTLTHLRNFAKGAKTIFTSTFTGNFGQNVLTLDSVSII